MPALMFINTLWLEQVKCSDLIKVHISLILYPLPPHLISFIIVIFLVGILLCQDVVFLVIFLSFPHMT